MNAYSYQICHVLLAVYSDCHIAEVMVCTSLGGATALYRKPYIFHRKPSGSPRESIVPSLCAVAYFRESSATGLACEVFEGSISYGCYSLCVVNLFL